MNALIRKLVEAWGPSGYEHQVRRLIQEEVADLVDEMRVDALGNLICRVGSGGKKVMVSAHMDEIGVMAMFAEPESGYLRFDPIGGLLHSTLAGNRVRFEDGTTGVIGVLRQLRQRAHQRALVQRLLYRRQRWQWCSRGSGQRGRLLARV